MTDTASALAGLPKDVRDQLNSFASALERLTYDELRMHVAIDRPGHAGAIAAAKRVAQERGLEPAVAAAVEALDDAMVRLYGTANFRVSGVFGLNMPQTTGAPEDQVRVIQSLDEAVTAIVLGGHLDPADRAELLGLWDRLLP